MDHRTSSDVNNYETETDEDNDNNNITCDENVNIGSKNIKNLHDNFPTLIKSRASSNSRSQKYPSANLGNQIEVYVPSRRLSESDTGGTVTIETEQTPLIHRTSELEDASNYKSLMDLEKSTVKQTIFNAVNILMGIGILALPFAFKHTGWIIGISVFLFCSMSTNYTAKILKNCLDVDRTCLSYVDLAYLAYGNKGKYFIGTIFLMDLYNATVALMILAGDSLKTLFPQSDLTQLKFILFLIITPTTWLPIRYLSYTSFFGIIATAALALVLLFDGFTKLDSPGSLIQPMDTYLWPQKWIAVPLAFGLINAGFTGHAIFPSLYRDMEKPNEYRKMVNSSYSITSTFYITVAVSGYLMFGSQTMQEITQNLMVTPGYSLFLNSIVVWLTVINPLSKYPLTLTPINLSVEVTFLNIPYLRILFRSQIVKTVFMIISRTFISFLVVSTAILFPKFDRAVSLLGSLFSFLISLIFPLLCNLKIFGSTLPKNEIRLNLFILVISVIMGVLGTIWTFVPREWLDD
ncbi:hypothetical protein Glove_441g63 [Diversispora epigaea]|uniref:Amino acid transporter transmembrane domain-containing protein n=1 Tax=Diversispora epigaea TaxID=1348612 RepID=A0A397GRB1_9GLOM|nr:hypothetical protein Glove_441g63 [Diversispora epigaea]